MTTSGQLLYRVASQYSWV